MTADCPSQGRHGTLAAYKVDGCRCPEGTAASTRWSKQYRLDLHRGRPRTVPAAGTARRIRALLAIGWSRAHIAGALNLANDRQLNRITSKAVTVRAETAERVDRLYRRLAETQGPSPFTAGHARARGYAPPWAWDDDTIDDPNAQPADWRRDDRHRVEDRVEDILWLRRCGVSDREIAQRIGIAERTIPTYLTRVGQGSAA